jgi:hypothetical protein
LTFHCAPSGAPSLVIVLAYPNPGFQFSVCNLWIGRSRFKIGVPPWRDTGRNNKARPVLLLFYSMKARVVVPILRTDHRLNSHLSSRSAQIRPRVYPRPFEQAISQAPLLVQGPLFFSNHCCFIRCFCYQATRRRFRVVKLDWQFWEVVLDDKHCVRN